MVANFTLQFVKKKEEAIDIFSFYFQKPQSLSFKPGEYLKVIFDLEEDDGHGNSRFFTISGSPTEEYVMITTKLQPSQFKKQLYSLKPGDLLTGRGPYGDFILDYDPTQNHIFISGGMGVTPFRSMIKYIYDKKMPISIDLFASYGDKDHAVFFDELSQIDNELEKFHYHPVYSKIQGRFTVENIKKEVANLTNNLYYIVGSAEMVEEITSQLKAESITPERIRSEKFPGYTYE